MLVRRVRAPAPRQERGRRQLAQQRQGGGARGLSGTSGDSVARAGAGSAARVGAGAGSVVRTGSGAGLGTGAAGSEGEAAAWTGGGSPVTTVFAVTTVLGSSVIFWAETRMPFLRSNTVAGLPST